jgi:tetratricopeptide (TPR) repeat protein
MKNDPNKSARTSSALANAATNDVSPPGHSVQDQWNVLMDPAPDKQEREELEVALARHKKAVEEDPNAVWDWYGWGAALVNMWRSKEAIPVLRKAVELSPDTLVIRYLLGVAYHDVNEPEAASKELAWVVAHNPQLKSFTANFMLGAMTNLALCQEKLGKPDAGIDTLLPALNEAVGILFNLAWLHGRAKRDELSLPYIHAAYLLRPNNGDIVHQYGAMLLRMKRHREAIKILKKAVELKPYCECAWYDLGLAHSCFKQHKSARHYFLKSLEIDPGHTMSYYDLACLDAREGKRDAAFAYLQEALAHGFRDAGYLQRDKDFRSLRRDRRWKDLIRKMGELELAQN